MDHWWHDLGCHGCKHPRIEFTIFHIGKHNVLQLHYVIHNYKSNIITKHLKTYVNIIEQLIYVMSNHVCIVCCTA